MKTLNVSLAVVALGSCLSPHALATEGGAQVEPLTTEGSMSANLPPPGSYYLNYDGVIYANRFRTDNALAGLVLKDFHVDAEVEAPRLFFVTPIKIFGGNFDFDVIQPIEREHVRIGGSESTNFGLGDTIFDPAALNWHLGRWHLVSALRVFTPDGQYRTSDIANLSQNHWALAYVQGITYYQPGGFEASALSFVTHNFQDPTTRYTSGRSAQFDYFTGWHFGHLAIGAAGSFFRQFTPDHGAGAVFGSFEGEEFSIGPSLSYTVKGIRVEAKWTHDVVTQNRPEASMVWVKAVVHVF